MRLIVALFALIALVNTAYAGQQYPAFQKMLTDICMSKGNFTRAECAAAVRRNMKPPLRNGYWHVATNGGRPRVFIDMALTMNRQGNTAVFGRHCNSACAIAWNLAKKKCLLFGGQVGLAQHKFTGGGKAVNVKSRDPNYWKQITKGFKEPSHEMVYWNGTAPKCPEGIEIAGYRSERSFRSRNSAPSIFRAPY